MMATLAEGPVGPAPASGAVAIFIDRWIFVFMAALFIATALAGFVPTSIEKVMAVQAGQRPPFPIVLHVHAVLMGAWLLLLLAQTSLMATRRSGFHKQLGLAAIVLAPAMVVTGFFLVPAMFHYNWAMIEAAPPSVPAAELEIGRNFFRSLVAGQTALGAMFVIFVTWAFLVRKTDMGMHKRLMILATAVVLPAAIDRIAWLPTTYPGSFVSPALYTVLWIAPMLVWDLVRSRTLHRAYIIWFSIYVPVSILVINLWWTPGWMATAQKLMGA